MEKLSVKAKFTAQNTIFVTKVIAKSISNFKLFIKFIENGTYYWIALKIFKFKA